MGVLKSYRLARPQHGPTTTDAAPTVTLTIAAQRNLFNRLLGCLHHCLQTDTTYGEATAFPTDDQRSEPHAA